ncbi:MAG TPA: hypothetical protein VN026_18055 [Bacteroidia bacterium]|jgi:hypothetical protein|nr:hypothetical protein [Bacteroidia bacterium]
MIRKYLILVFFISQISVFAQKEDETKMIREIVKVEVEKSKFAVKPSPPPVAETPGKKGKKKAEVVEEPVVEAGAADTVNPYMPAPAAEILKRAQNWYTIKPEKFTKSAGTNNGNSVCCNLQFPFKQKILNPEADIDGSISMDLTIDAKEGKYRYTIKNIRHKANKAGMSGGDIYLNIPECGSMYVSDKIWKQIRSEAFGNAQIVIDDLKTMMNREVADSKKDDW